MLCTYIMTVTIYLKTYNSFFTNSDTFYQEALEPPTPLVAKGDPNPKKSHEI